ncbi:hypothetical protein GGQ68_000034 [Sagittula marina]|uniref:Uncharacterized protein n=1 Tax=Sagittula marina TaxID=943940 RepID=A0A7W6DIL5_9RHOB|nr:hypothetical protein [Sagittula marina]MBB3983723.1 hypothetical protein [Sagittula marina]
MRRLIIALLVSFIPSSILAQEVIVRTGEHGDFTRLVMRIPAGANWSIKADPAKDKMIVELRGQDAEFDLSAAFQRIDRSRISELTRTASGGLEIELGCDCGAETFVADGNLLVIDVRPGISMPENSGSIVATNEPNLPAPSAPQVMNREDAPLLSDLGRVRVGASPGVGPLKQPDPLLPRLPTRMSFDAEMKENKPELPISTSSRVGGQIAEDLAAAATAGLLTPAVRTVPGPLGSTSSEQVDRSIAAESASTADLAIQIVEGFTGADRSGLSSSRVSLGGENCIADGKLELANWVDPDTDAATAFAEWRSDLFGEFDKINPKKINGYARALIHFGFGAEARQVLDMDPDVADQTLVSLSFLVDGENDPTGIFSGQMECLGAASLWSVLADERLGAEDTFDQKAVLRAFENLPSHLKRHLGPILAQKFEAASYSDSAKEVYRRLERSLGEETPSISLGRAQIDLAAGKLNAAEQRLKPLSEQGSPETPEAIVARVRIAEAKEEKLPERILDLAEAYSNELRDSAEGVDLWQAHLRGLLLNGAFEQAFGVLQQGKSIPQDVMTDMNEVAVGYLVEKAEDITFLKLVVPMQAVANAAPLRDRTLLDIADRLVKIGMPEPAFSYLDQITNPESDRAVRLIRAAALLDTDQPAEAEIHLVGLKGEDVSKLRAEARRKMGDHTFAGEIYEQLGEEADATTQAWLSGDWEQVADDSNSAFSESARLLQTAQPALDSAIPTLAEVETLTDQSSSSLNTLRTLLDATRIEPGN